MIGVISAVLSLLQLRTDSIMYCVGILYIFSLRANKIKFKDGTYIVCKYLVYLQNYR